MHSNTTVITTMVRIGMSKSAIASIGDSVSTMVIFLQPYLFSRQRDGTPRLPVKGSGGGAYQNFASSLCFTFQNSSSVSTPCSRSCPAFSMASRMSV